MLPLDTAPQHARDAALTAFNLARKIHQATQFPQPAARMAQLSGEIAEAQAALAILAETYPAEPKETNVRRLSERAKRAVA